MLADKQLSPAALQATMLALDGFPVFPASTLDKAPMVAGGFKAATADCAQVEAWWRHWPNAMIGLPTGSALGAFVLDVDGEKGRASLAVLEAQHGPLPKAIRVSTPSGGMHVYLRLPVGLALKSRARDIAPGLDVRGANAAGEPNGYVIAAGSVNSTGGKYELIDATDFDPARFAAAPDWLLFLVGFGAGERDQLARVGITGPEAFCGHEPSEWLALAIARIKLWKASQASPILLAASPAAAAPEQQEKSPSTQEQQQKASPAAPAGARDLGPYLRTAIEAELVKLRLAARGNRDVTFGEVALKIHARLKGAEAQGFDAAELEEWAHDRFVTEGHAVGLDADPDVKWQRCKADARPADLSHVGIQSERAPAAEQFERIPAAPAGKIEAPASRKREATKRRPLQWIDDGQAIQDIDWLAEDMIPAGSIGFLAAQPGGGKSALAVDLALHLALGRDFFGSKVASGGTFIAAAEHAYALPQRIAAARMAKFAEAEKLPIVFDDSVGNLLASDEISALIERVKLAGAEMRRRYGVPLRLVVVDTFAAAFALDDENAAGQAGKAVAVLRKVATECGVTVLAVHHFGKDEARGMRGSSALRGAADFILSVKRDGATRELALWKSRDAEEGALGLFTLEGQEIGTKADGRPISQPYVLRLEGDAPFADLDAVETPNARNARSAIQKALATKGQTLATESGPVRAVLYRDARQAFSAEADGSEAAVTRAFERGWAEIKHDFSEKPNGKTKWIWPSAGGIEDDVS